jgi:hypothetical protein
MGTPLWLIQLVEITVGPQDPADGPDAQMYAGLLQGRLHPECAELRVLLQAPHRVHRPEIHLPDTFRPPALAVLESLRTLLDPTSEHPVDGGTVHLEVPGYALVRPPLVVQRDERFSALPGFGDLVVGLETTERLLKGRGSSSRTFPTVLTSGFLPEKT